MRVRNWLLALALLLSANGIAGATTIAYDNVNLGQGNQDYGGSLGLDFTVNSPIFVTGLGAYDTGNPAQLIGQDASSGVTVYIAKLSNSTQIGPSVTFTPTNAGTQINADAFLSVPEFVLPAGNYSVVAWNDNNYNTNGPPNGTSTENTGGGLISFIGGGRYGSAGAFPGTGDGGPTNRYDAGTFQFRGVPEPTSIAMAAIALGALLCLGRKRV